MSTRRRTHIYDFGFRDCAVWYDSKIPLRGQKMRSAPIQLDNLALGSAFEADPIIQPIGAAEIENKARENIAQRALKREADDNRDCPGSRNQALHWKVEDIGDNGEKSREIDKPSQNVLQELAFPFTELEDEHAAQDAY